MEFLENAAEDSQTTKKYEKSNMGKIFVGITGGIVLGLTIISAPFLIPAIRKFCLPFVPATDEQIKNIFIALKNRTGTLVDLGSGDGRIVIDAAKRGYVSHGVELNPWLVLFSKFSARKQGQQNRTDFFCRDLWKFNLNKYDNIVVFGVKEMMPTLQKKILSECQTHCKIVACGFPLPNLTPIRTIGSGIDTVWIYEMPNY